MPVPTPWIRTYDTPELYLGGYKSGVAAAEVGQRGQIAAMEAANRIQAAQIEAAARQDIANKQLLAEEHRHAIEDQYKQIQLGMDRQRLEIQTKMDQQKLDQAARQAATVMEYEKRYKAGEDATKLMQELGPRMGEGFYKPPVTRPAREYPSPYVAAKARVIENTLTELNKARAIADKKHLPEIDEQIAIANKQLDDLFNPGAKKVSTAGRYVRNPDGTLRFEPPEPASLGEAMRRPSLMTPGQITLPGGLSMSLSPSEVPADIPSGVNVGRISIGGQAAAVPARTALESMRAEPDPGEPKREYGKVYSISEGPYRGMEMLWTKDVWGHGIWQAPPKEAPKWLRSAGEAIEGAAGKGWNMLFGPTPPPSDMIRGSVGTLGP